MIPLSMQNLSSVAYTDPPRSRAMCPIISCNLSLQPTPPTMRTCEDPTCAMARSVISTNMANTVSCSEKHKSSGVKSAPAFICAARASADARMPENEQSIPLTAVVTDLERTSKSIETISNSYIQRLAKYPISLLRICNNLRVTTRNVQHNWVLRASDISSHLNVSHAVIHTHKWSIPEQTQRSGGHGDRVQRGAHTGSLCVADAVDICGCDFRFGEGFACKTDEVCAVMGCCVFGEEPCAWRGNECVAEVGEDLGFGWCVEDDTDAELVGGAFAAKSDI
ncbi:hypothetical protein HG531_004361 [Fusarium graminearum]|nr:hypothetical protein HG531_004361 [Fusarium graminearum]